jgi:hypothetical protein
MAGFTDPHNGAIITTLFVMVHGWLGVREGEDDDACMAPRRMSRTVDDPAEGAAMDRQHIWTDTAGLCRPREVFSA